MRFVFFLRLNEFGGKGSFGAQGSFFCSSFFPSQTVNENELARFVLNILLNALHEHPTLYQPTSTTIRLVSPFIILYHCNLYAQLLCTWYSGQTAVSSEQRVLITPLLLRPADGGVHTVLDVQHNIFILNLYRLQEQKHSDKEVEAVGTVKSSF